MGQVALGFRSLAIKLSIFFVMAALLAWALGGTLSPKLWPRPKVVDFDGVSFNEQEWYWRLSVGGSDDHEVRWAMMKRDETGVATPIDTRAWVEVAGPVAANGKLYYAGRAFFNPNEPWRIECIDEAGQGTTSLMPDRLAVERQLARVKAGLDLQSPDEAMRDRSVVLDPHKATGEIEE